MLIEVMTFSVLTRLGAAIEQSFGGAGGFFRHALVGTDNLRMVSIILLLLAFSLFLFLIVILYIKSLLSFIKENSEGFLNNNSGSGSASVGGHNKDVELEKELEKELERDLEASRINRDMMEKKEKERALKKQQEKRAKTNAKEEAVVKERSKVVEFDWKTGRITELDERSAGVSLSAVQQSEPLKNLTGLIINMLGRGIDAGKIAQTIKNKTSSLASEEEVIQTIDSIKSFISIANNGKFAQLPDGQLLPDPEDALTHLAHGRTDECLSLMEALINAMVDKAAQTNMTQKRDLIFLEASNYACVFGSIAQIDQDAELANGAFELAVELSPKNANAWSRCGDSYVDLHNDSKAMLAYQNVLALGDVNMYPHQIANADKHLAKFYEAQGDVKKAMSLAKASEDYYALIGIDALLSPKEQNIIDIIEEKQDETMGEIIGKLMNLSRKKHMERAIGQSI